MSIPNFLLINPDLGTLIVESVSINSGYTSKVLVRIDMLIVGDCKIESCAIRLLVKKCPM